MLRLNLCKFPVAAPRSDAFLTLDLGSRIRDGKIRIQDEHPVSARLAGFGTWIRQMSEKKSSSGMVGADTGSSPDQKPQGTLILYIERPREDFVLVFLRISDGSVLI